MRIALASPPIPKSLENEGQVLTEWGSMQNPYYEKAMMMRPIENSIYFASVNYTSKYAESATSIINPDGTCLAYQQYGRSGTLIADIDPALATGFLAGRFRNWLYAEGGEAV